MREIGIVRGFEMSLQLAIHSVCVKWITSFSVFFLFDQQNYSARAYARHVAQVLAHERIIFIYTIARYRTRSTFGKTLNINSTHVEG